MLLNRWKKTLSQRCIFIAEDGRIFAFPVGPFVAYLLPDAKSQSLVVEAIFWKWTASMAICVATIAALVTFKLPTDILLLAMVLQYIVFIPLVSFITRKFVRLPIALSIRACASLHDPAILYDYTYRLSFMVILSTVLLFVLPINPVWYAMLIWLLGATLVHWYMVILRHRDRTYSESFRDESH